MKHWTESPALSKDGQELMQSIINQIPEGIARSGFEMLLSKLAQGPFEHYIINSDGDLVGGTNDREVADAAFDAEFIVFDAAHAREVARDDFIEDEEEEEEEEDEDADDTDD